MRGPFVKLWRLVSSIFFVLCPRIEIMDLPFTRNEGKQHFFSLSLSLFLSLAFLTQYFWLVSLCTPWRTPRSRQLRKNSWLSSSRLQTNNENHERGGPTLRAYFNLRLIQDTAIRLGILGRRIVYPRRLHEY